MLVLNVRNVNEALPLALLHLRERGVPRVSRGMKVIEYPEPVATVYYCPQECVLFDAERDANPFFHFFEALWILNGGQDVATPARYLPRIAEYSDNGTTFHGAYGYRLRSAFGMDQLDRVVDLLKIQPDTRRAVISIYDPRLDLGTDSKDIPCNDMVMFKIRDGKLHMTVCNRSNDAIWGAYGANAVQFSFLLQYVAMRVGVAVGRYTQVSDSLHVYEDNPYWQAHKADHGVTVYDPYASDMLCIDSPSLWNRAVYPEDLDEDIRVFHLPYQRVFYNSEFFRTALCMKQAHACYRAGMLRTARRYATEIPVPDWRKACVDWIQRRIDRRQPEIVA
jgi:thymidylate synthase